ncbi:hypothetical protein ABJI51_31145 [Amycolatopsis sp. NEAU-NG30]|uniref:Uncharacterized protein n=1 Tax=Amycolatopsis melonis TaxID=3156488 RepID=A0ABV0LQD1_9PSEU
MSGVDGVRAESAGESFGTAPVPTGESLATTPAAKGTGAPAEAASRATEPCPVPRVPATGEVRP